MTVHKPVLFKEVVDNLNLKNGSIVVDATLGGGGHSLEIIKKILPGGKLIAIDQDESAIQNFKNKLDNSDIKPRTENLKLVSGNFSELENILADLKISAPNAIIADLGISSDQLEDSKRGFSFQKEGMLDMRLSLRTTNQLRIYECTNSDLTAREIVNCYPEKELVRILRDFGEEKYSRMIAKAIARQRKIKPIESTKDLVEVIERVVPESYKHKKIHFATKTFQAIRIEVNQEFKNLEKFLFQAVEILEKGGRLGIISFHSGEDRLIKRIFRENARGCICPAEFPICRCGKTPKIKLITKKPIVPGSSETRDNPRSRSAKLRIIEKI
jgi:16S rRNA (cytosine1402-N4)-methyltransferase